MLRRIPKRLCVCGLLAAVIFPAGCTSEMGRYFAYLIHGGKARSVDAEFDGFEEKTVAVVIYCDQRTRYEHPDLPLTLSSAIASRLEDNIKDMKVVPPAKVVRYQDENIYWDEMDRRDLGKALGADFVLFVPLEEFGTRLPDSAYLYRGRVTSEPSVYDVSKSAAEARVYKVSQKIRVKYPEREPAGLVTENDRQIRLKTEKLFAEQVAWKFYDHEEELKQ